MTDIKGRTAVVTGGGSGIGKGMALALVEQGASVAIADIILENAQAVADEIQAAGGKAVAVHVDVCERDSIRGMKAEAEAALGPISLVLANAGATNFDLLHEIKDAEADWIIQVNLMGVLQTLQAFLPDMIARGQGGHVVGTASVAGFLPTAIPVHTVYAAAKMGIVGLMMNLSCELEEHGIGSTVYPPGGVIGNMKANNERYRPARFGGPGTGDVFVPAASFANSKLGKNSLEPIEAGRMVCRGIRNNRLIVVDHSYQREVWETDYARHVRQAYDDVEDYEREHGAPEKIEWEITATESR
jgi:NAD(P)-dependent dehydrogenase (short-subunit alcohol dehydrogenase family)